LTHTQSCKYTGCPHKQTPCCNPPSHPAPPPSTPPPGAPPPPNHRHVLGIVHPIIPLESWRPPIFKFHVVWSVFRIIPPESGRPPSRRPGRVSHLVGLRRPPTSALWQTRLRFVVGLTWCGGKLRFVPRSSPTNILLKRRYPCKHPHSHPPQS